MNNRGQVLMVSPGPIPIIVGLIYLTILGALIPNIESIGILGFIAIIVSMFLVTFVFGIVVPNEIGIYLRSIDKK